MRSFSHGDHPGPEILERLLGELDPRTNEHVSAHLSVCGKCRRYEEEWRQVLELVDRAPWTRTAHAGSARPLLRATLGGLARRRAGIKTRLSPLPEAGLKARAWGEIVAVGDGDASLHVNGLDPLPLGHVYALWWRHAGMTRQLAVLAVGEDGRGRVAFRWPEAVAPGDHLLVTAQRFANDGVPRLPCYLVGVWPGAD